MIDTGIIVTGAIGMLTTIVSSWVSWFFARKKYNSEVDNNLIENMQESLDFYKKLSDDNRDRLKDVLRRNEALEQEVNDLRRQVFNLMSSICLDMSCQMRKKEILHTNKEKNPTTLI